MWKSSKLGGVLLTIACFQRLFAVQFSVVGGGVALAAAGALVAQSFAPLGALLGGGAAVAAAGGGLMVAQDQCLGELYILNDRSNVMNVRILYCRATVLQSQEWTVLSNYL